VIWIWLIKNGYGLVSLALVILVMNILRPLAGIIILKRLYPEIKFSFSLANKKTTKKLLGYSKISFGITIGWLIIFNTDTFLLGLFSSSAAAGIYNPGAQLMLYLRNFVNAIGIPLTPAISHLDTNNDQERIKRIYHQGIKYVSYFSFIALVGVIFYAHSFVKLWLPPEFYQSADVMIILSIGTAFFLPQIIGNSILFGSENHKYILQVLIFESLFKIILAVILIPRYNIIGMAFANAIPQIIFYTTLYPYYMSRLLKISYRHILTTILSMSLLGTLVSLPTAVYLKKMIPVNSWSMLIINVSIVLIIALIPTYFIIDREDKRKIVNFFKK
ncbi:MAG: oligosaccharide flippase family protein, partial [FCB group bacterium]|nr:oligosaccharide flippase family protein [FCB group bacterium]